MTLDQDHPPAPAGAFHAAASVVALNDPSGSAAESIRALRTQLVTLQERDGLSGLTTCGPSAGVGSTFIAVNLAVALSQIGIKTLLIDADMRDPGIGRMIIPPRQLDGLRQCLSGELDPDDVIEHDVMENLSILYSGGTATNPQELLAAPRFRELVDLWAREYDLTIIDTPPANRSADGRYIGGVVGSALVVARQDHTSVSDLRTAISELEQGGVQVVGTILNKF